MKRLLTVLIAILALGLPGHADAAKRVALVIGNADYTQVGRLDNPARDATAMGDVLRKVGFDVVQGIDLNRNGMQEALKVFSAKLRTAEVALFYYAGHGIQVDGENYLIPIDAEIENETDLAFATVPLGLIEDQMSKVPRVKLIMLDACRDNPFKMDLLRNLSPTRALSMTDGLAPVSLSDDVGGTFIAFATDPGAYASDGLGLQHAPFTQALLDNMARPGMEIHEMMIDVRAQVWEQTDRAQRPWSNSSLTGKFYFSEPQQAPVTASSTFDLELAFWESVKEGGSDAEYRAYLSKFPNGVFAEIAEARLDKPVLQLTQATRTTEPAQPSNAATADPVMAQRIETTLKSPLDDTSDLAGAAANTRDEPTLLGAATSSEQFSRFAAAMEPLAATTEPEPRAPMALAIPVVSDSSITSNNVQTGNERLALLDQNTQVTKRYAKPRRDLRRQKLMQRRAATSIPQTAPTTTPGAAEDAMSMTENQRRQIENHLLSLGINPGLTDGIFDERTRSAIRTWQWTEELPPTGYLTRQQVSLLVTHAQTTYIEGADLDAEEASFQPLSQNLGRAKSTKWPSFEVFAPRKTRSSATRRVDFRHMDPEANEGLWGRAIREIGSSFESDVASADQNADQQQPRQWLPQTPDQ